MSTIDAALFEHFNLRIKHSNRMTSRRLSRKMQETVQKSAMCGVRGTENGVKRDGRGTAGSKKRQRPER